VFEEGIAVFVRNNGTLAKLSVKIFGLLVPFDLPNLKRVTPVLD
jgi:hypothetical protein